MSAIIYCELSEYHLAQFVNLRHDNEWISKYLFPSLRGNEFSPLRKADQDSRTVPVPLMTSDQGDFRVLQRIFRDGILHAWNGFWKSKYFEGAQIYLKDPTPGNVKDSSYYGERPAKDGRDLLVVHVVEPHWLKSKILTLEKKS